MRRCELDSKSRGLAGEDRTLTLRRFRLPASIAVPPGKKAGRTRPPLQSRPALHRENGDGAGGPRVKRAMEREVLRSETGGVMVSVVAPVLACALAAASLVIGLAAVVRMAGPPAAGEPIEGIIALPDPLVAAILGLFAMAGLVFLASAWRRGLFRRRPEDDAAGLPRESSRMPRWGRVLWRRGSLVHGLGLAHALVRGT